MSEKGEANWPDHVRKVKNMSSRELLKECEAIFSLDTIEPDRQLPGSFKDDKSS